MGTTCVRVLSTSYESDHRSNDYTGEPDNENTQDLTMTKVLPGDGVDTSGNTFFVSGLKKAITTLLQIHLHRNRLGRKRFSKT